MLAGLVTRRTFTMLGLVCALAVSLALVPSASAYASSTASGLAKNAWILAELGGAAVQAGTGSTGIADVSEDAARNTPAKDLPTTPVPFSKASGIKLVSKRLLRGLMNVGDMLPFAFELVPNMTPDLPAGEGTPAGAQVYAGTLHSGTVAADGSVAMHWSTAPSSASSLAQYFNRGQRTTYDPNQGTWGSAINITTGTATYETTGPSGAYVHTSRQTFPAGTLGPNQRIRATFRPCSTCDFVLNIYLYHPDQSASQQYPPGSSTNPLRRLTATIKCSDGSVISKVTDWFTIPDPPVPGWTSPEMPQESCPAGTWILETQPGIDTQVKPGQVTNTPLSDPVPQNPTVAAVAPRIVAGDAPTLVLEYTTGTEWRTCEAAPAMCRDWDRVPDKDQRFRCVSDGLVVALSECVIFRDWYSPEPRLTDPAAPTDTGGGGQTTDCFPSGWGIFNPAEWVEQPIGCALRKAFVPTVPVMTQLQPLGDLLGTKPPMSWLADFGHITGGAVVPGGAGGAPCPDWVVTVEGHAENVVCDSSYTAAIVAARPVLAAMLLAMAFYPLARSIWYAVLPVVRAVPTSAR